MGDKKPNFLKNNNNINQLNLENGGDDGSETRFDFMAQKQKIYDKINVMISYLRHVVAMEAV